MPTVLFSFFFFSLFLFGLFFFTRFQLLTSTGDGNHLGNHSLGSDIDWLHRVSHLPR